MKFIVLPKSVGLLKFMLNVLSTIDIQGRGFYLRDFIKYTFNIGLRRDACELISFKLCMMLDTTRFYTMIPV